MKQEKEKKQKSILQKMAVLALGATLSLGGGTPAHGANPNFYQELQQLTKSQDTTHFFGSMRFTIHSDTLTVDGKEQSLPAAPEIRNARTMLPFDTIAEITGMELTCNESANKVTLVSPWGDTIICSAGSAYMTVNGTRTALDSSPYWQDGSCYLPLRAVAEALYMEVSWEHDTSSVRLTAPYQTARIIVYTDELDTDSLSAQTAITNGSGMWVVQFASPAEARKVIEQLKSQEIKAAPDAYISLF